MNVDDISVQVNDLAQFDVCDDASFDSPLANTPATMLGQTEGIGGCSLLDLSGALRVYMAGMWHPSLSRCEELIRDASGATELELGAMHELLQQLGPWECREVMASAGATPRQMAAILRASGVRRGRVVAWINHYSSDPAWGDNTPSIFPRILPRAH
ncbi:MAG: hypothetical protein F4Y86_05690 [Gammaproteobacteria bacterium]|nr:hypothetical protein [Gammaproteobacteria bacterium]MYB36222.1 hypothetical protein [Gammaproteobacteria bacterium]